MDTFRAAGSDRKLSELGLDLPDFLDPVIDPSELYSSTTFNMTSLDFYGSRDQQRAGGHHQFQNGSYNNHSDSDYQNHNSHNPSGLHTGNHQEQLEQHGRSTAKDATNRVACYMVDNALPGSGVARYGQSNTRRFQTTAHDNNDDDLLATDLRLVDVVNDVDADDDEVVLGNGWLDDILDDDDDEDDDEDRQSGSHVICATGDDVIELQHVSDEHSYSLSNDTADDDLETFDVKMESDFIDVDGGLFEMINPEDLTLLNGTESTVTMSDLMATSLGARAVGGSDDVMGRSIVKSEPVDACSTDSCYSMSPGHSHVSGYDVTDIVDLPLTPPSSSSCSSESDAAGLSPRRTPPTTPSSPRHVITAHRTHYHGNGSSSQHQYHHGLHHQTSSGIGGISQHNVWTATLSTAGHQPFPTNPIPSSGMLILSEEEKRTLVAEGYAVPSKLPLTKQEEKNLKKIRRKIKNKISAQESRRKKKEYMETLEKKVEVVSIENISLRKKIDLLENNNRSLASQLQKLQSLASKLTTQMQAASCIAVN